MMKFSKLFQCALCTLEFMDVLQRKRNKRTRIPEIAVGFEPTIIEGKHPYGRSSSKDVSIWATSATVAF